MQLPARFAYLAKEPGPRMLVEALRWLGTAEIPGKPSNPAIMAWALAVGANSYYNNDDTPWCALAMAYFAKVAGKQLPPDPLAAKSWAKFGKGVARPELGDIVVFPHHVAIYVGETSTTWQLLGGNQGDKVSIISWAKSSPVLGFRRPIYTTQPANVRAIPLGNTGGPVGGKIV